jgi:UDP-N-acetylmuramate--alanine ligase
LPLEGVTCSVNEDAVSRLLMLELEECFLWCYKRNGNQDLHFGLPGRHNLMNALMAIAMAKLFGTPTCYKTIASLRIKRRFSYQIKTDVRCILMIMHINRN